MHVSEEGLEAVCLQLKRRGVGRYRDAVRIALENGYTLAQIGNVIDRFDDMDRRGWHSPTAVLFTRLTKVSANVPMDEGWPHGDRELIGQVRAKAAETRRGDNREDAETRRKQAAAEAVERQRLEAKHGATLDAYGLFEMRAALELAGLGKQIEAFGVQATKRNCRFELLRWMDAT